MHEVVVALCDDANQLDQCHGIAEGVNAPAHRGHSQDRQVEARPGQVEILSSFFGFAGSDREVERRAVHTRRCFQKREGCSALLQPGDDMEDPAGAGHVPGSTNIGLDRSRVCLGVLASITYSAICVLRKLAMKITSPITMPMLHSGGTLATRSAKSGVTATRTRKLPMTAADVFCPGMWWKPVVEKRQKRLVWRSNVGLSLGFWGCLDKSVQPQKHFSKTRG